MRLLVPRCYFNPRSPDGERPAIHPSLGACLIISIHAPRMGSDFGTPSQRTVDCRFQSTLPGWGATLGHFFLLSNDYISIHAPRMGSDNTHPMPANAGLISIHAPRMGSDVHRIRVDFLILGISIHAPRMGSDGNDLCCHGFVLISIHAPRMGSDPSGDLLPEGEPVISIHAPRMGSDRENGHLRPRYGQNHPFSTLIVSQIVVDVLGTVRKSQKTPAH